MAGAGGLLPIAISLSSVQPGLESLFAVRGSLNARLGAAADGALFVSVSGLRVPVPKSSGLKPGDSVVLTLAREGGELRLLLKQAHSKPPPVQGQSRIPLERAGVRATAQQPGTPPSGITSLPNAPAPPAFVANALPAGLTVASPITRLLATLFSGSGRLSELIGALRTSSNRAGATTGHQPAVAPNEGAAVSAESIRKWVHIQRSSPEAKIAASLTSDAPLEGDEVVELARLRRALVGRAAGSAEPGRAENAFERVSASRLWNLHGLDQPYLFAELPVAPDTFWRRAQLHVFGEGDDPKNRFNGPLAVVLDMDTDALGPIWVSIRTDGRGACSCVLRAAEPDTVDVFAAASPDLEAALQRSGYAAADVRVEPWREDRLDTLESMTARLSGLDMEA